jgi:DNA-binding NarL/FixJ family response regulator
MPDSTPAPITFAIVEDDMPTRQAILSLLSGEKQFRCLAAYGTGEEAITGIGAKAPDVILVDINLPGMNGIECVTRLKAGAPTLQVLMLTTYEDSDKIFRSLRAGAAGYLLKKCIAEDLVSAIEQVHAGGAPMSMPVARKVVAHFHESASAGSELAQLTARENQILELLASGCLYKEIGDRLGISFSTVRAHLRNIYEKLHVQSRTEATVKFLKRG